MSGRSRNQPVRARALLFGLNYAYESDATLNGCINDARNMAQWLAAAYGRSHNIAIEVVTDDERRQECTGQGVMKKLYELAVASLREDLDFVYVHWSGHGSWIRDASGDELDRRDECLVPSDFKAAGVLADDVVTSVFASFNPKTRVVCVFDSCYSGTVADLRFTWEGPLRWTQENRNSPVGGKVLALSGCMDTQTSADAFNINGDRTWTGALTACLLKVLQGRNGADARRDAFHLMSSVRVELRRRGFTQVPKLSSSHRLTGDRTFLP